MNRLVAETNFFNDDFKQFSDVELWVEQALNTVAQASNLLMQPHGEIGLLLTTDAEIQKLNAQFRQQDKATNVLSFPAEADEFDDLFKEDDDSDLAYLGDIAMAFETLTREAETQNKPIKQHFIHLLIHSILHLLGYDHIDDDDAQIMESLEIRLLATINIENPYD